MMVQDKEKTVYHGTSAAAAESIRREQRFHESRADNEWLGWGVYFFKYEDHARRWIQNRKLDPGDVLTVQLEYDDEELLDLDDPAQMSALNREMAKLNWLVKDKIRPGEENETWKHWCLSCNMYRKMHKRIGVISFTFPQRKRNTPSWFPTNERQICVSRHEIIKKIV